MAKPDYPIFIGYQSIYEGEKVDYVVHTRSPRLIAKAIQGDGSYRLEVMEVWDSPEKVTPRLLKQMNKWYKYVFILGKNLV